MRVLVTGASGRLAPYVVSELGQACELVLFSRRQPAGEVLAGHEWVQGDLTSYDQVRRAVEGVQAIQHLGAQTWPTDHPRWHRRLRWRSIPFDTTIKTNLMGTYYLMQAAVEEGVRVVVMAGSNCATGLFFRISDRPFPYRYLPLDEQHPTDVEDSYSFSKLAAEEMLASYTRAYGIRTYVARLGWICDRQERRRLAERASPANEWVDGMWTWVASEDCGRAHRMLMEAGLRDPCPLPEHDVYLVNADDTTALEPSLELVRRFRPDLLPLVRDLKGHCSFISTARLQAAVGWHHQEGWRAFLT